MSLEPVKEIFAEPLVPGHPVRDLRGDRQHLEHPVRQVRLVEQLRQAERPERGRGRRLDDDRRADRERGRHLVRHQVQREVERRDPEHGPVGEPPDQPDARAERGLGVQADQLVVAAPEDLAGPAERRDRPGRLHLRPLERLAALLGDQLGVLVDRLAQAARDVVERVGARVHREVPRHLERLGGRRDRLLHVLGRRHADLGDHGVVVGAVDLERPLAGPPLPVHQERSNAHRRVTSFRCFAAASSRATPSRA